MAKIVFNSFESFLSRHPESFSFTATITSAEPKGLSTDKSDKKLPTPYKLFHEWASLSLAGEWVTTKYKGGFIICVSDLKDATLISQKFGTTGTPRKAFTTERNVALGYKDDDYSQLARELGYDI
ncbi:hypothetical protein [Aromatoleum aromaticum]|nr:hypothetical protein [Aromatoleum aromaticum]NMG55345.1 hypothetical protein [Aromatoleum aromaticum]